MAHLIPPIIESYLTVMDLTQTPSDFNDPKTIGSVALDRGAMIYLNKFGPYHHTAILEFDPAKGFRGRHCHRLKTEYFYVISGTITGHYWVPPTAESAAHVMSHMAGHFIILKPGLFHTFHPQTSGWVLELSATPFDRHDVNVP